MTVPRMSVLLAASLVLVACSRKPIMLVSFSGTRSIQEGEAAQMFWTFRHADSVLVEPDGSLHPIEGHAVVTPTRTTDYRIVAYRPGVDSLVHPWRIAVASRTGHGGDVATGPQDGISAGPSVLSSNDFPSRWLRGVTTDAGATPATLRIVGARYAGTEAVVEAILLDTKGNDVMAVAPEATWLTTATCRDGRRLGFTTEAPSLHPWQSAAATASVVIAVDNSSAAGGVATAVLPSLARMLPGLVAADSVGVMLYDHTTTDLAVLQPAAATAAVCATTTIPESVGLTAMLAATRTAMRTLEPSTAAVRDVIVVAASDDNASLTTTTLDVIEQARHAGIRIHTVRIGTSAMGYVYRHISTATGGRSYLLPDGAVDEAADVVRELLYARRQYRSVVVPIDAPNDECADLVLRMQIANGSSVLIDSVRIPRTPRLYRPPYQAVAAFADSTDDELHRFDPLLALVGEDLMEHGGRRIELAASVSNDYSGDAMRRAWDRGRVVADFLIGYGVSARQVQVRAEGSTRPLYYMQLDGWQRRLNNRVEIRYLDRDTVPFTVIVGQVASEEMASTAVETWEDRGFRAYFEPIVVDRAPAYRIRLWGYASQEAATIAAKDVSRRYKVVATVE